MEGLGEGLAMAFWMTLIIGVVIGIVLWVGGGWFLHHVSFHLSAR